MADYPTEIFDPRERENKSGIMYDADKKTLIFNEDFTDIEDEVKAIETDIIQASRVCVTIGTENQVIPTAKETKVKFDTECFDVNSEFDSVTLYRFTAKREGYYFVRVEAHWLDTVVNKIYELRLKKNGDIVDHVPVTARGSGEQVTAMGKLVYLDVDDYIEVFVYHNVGANASLFYGETHSHFDIAKFPGA